MMPAKMTPLTSQSSLRRTRVRALFAAGLALAATCDAASAQSSVTMFGTVDEALGYLWGSGSSKFGVSHSGANVSRIGFRGVEDLGGGLSAGFWAEAGYNPDEGTGRNDGGLQFNRRSTVSLMGRFGELRIGRDDSATFLNTLIFDPFLTNGVAGTNAFAMLGAPIQISNAISYFLPSGLGGLYGQVQYAFGELTQTGTTTVPRSAGDYAGARIGYLSGPLHVAGSYGRLRGTPPAADLIIYNAAVSYDFGVIKPIAMVAVEKRDVREVRAMEVGATMPIGLGFIRAQVSRYNTTGMGDGGWTKFGVGGGYNLSKRTMLYASYGRINNHRDATRTISPQGLAGPVVPAGGKSNGVELGIRHFF
ncbi:MAG: porin [Burkholderiaceae bacterium]